MIRNLFNFIFSAPEDAAVAKTPPNAPLPASPITSPIPQTKDRVHAAADPAEDRRWNPIVVFFAALLIGFGLCALVMSRFGPQLVRPEQDAEFVLRPEQWVYVACAMLPAITAALLLASLAIPSLSRSRRIAVAAVLLAAFLASFIPFFRVANSFVQFTGDSVLIQPVWSSELIAYPYSKVAHIRATLIERSLPGFPSNPVFIFELEFDDGRRWDSEWYPYKTKEMDDSRLMRFLRDKTGVTPVLALTF